MRVRGWEAAIYRTSCICMRFCSHAKCCAGFCAARQRNKRHSQPSIRRPMRSPSPARPATRSKSGECQLFCAIICHEIAAPGCGDVGLVFSVGGGLIQIAVGSAWGLVRLSLKRFGVARNAPSSTAWCTLRSCSVSPQPTLCGVVWPMIECRCAGFYQARKAW